MIITTPDFSIVTPEWVRSRLKEFKINQTTLGKQIQISRHRISTLLSENPERGSINGTTQAAMYYFFREMSRACRVNAIA